MTGLDEFNIPCYTEQDQTGYQGYFVYLLEYTEGKGFKVARCSTGAEKPFGIIQRGGEGASASNPLSVAVRRRGLSVFKAAAEGVSVGNFVGAGTGGLGEAKTADGAYVMGVCVEAAEAVTGGGSIGRALLDGLSTLSVPGGH